jgi:hypothetical protein
LAAGIRLLRGVLIARLDLVAVDAGAGLRRRRADSMPVAMMQRTGVPGYAVV